MERRHTAVIKAYFSSAPESWNWALGSYSSEGSLDSYQCEWLHIYQAICVNLFCIHLYWAIRDLNTFTANCCSNVTVNRWNNKLLFSQTHFYLKYKSLQPVTAELIADKISNLFCIFPMRSLSKRLTEHGWGVCVVIFLKGDFSPFGNYSKGDCFSGSGLLQFQKNLSESDFCVLYSRLPLPLEPAVWSTLKHKTPKYKHKTPFNSPKALSSDAYWPWHS